MLCVCVCLCDLILFQVFPSSCIRTLYISWVWKGGDVMGCHERAIHSSLTLSSNIKPSSDITQAQKLAGHILTKRGYEVIINEQQQARESIFINSKKDWQNLYIIYRHICN